MKVLARYRSNTKQRGGVLVMFVLLVFGLMAVAALVIDIGLASATQGQMQAAVDSAALEGLRWRNTLHNDGFDDGFPDHVEDNPEPFENDRRRAAADIVAWVFDDDLDPGPDLRGYSVGPRLAVTGGVGEADAFGLIEITADERLDNPWLEPNLDSSGGFNLAEGDMVSGAFHRYLSPLGDPGCMPDTFCPAPSWPASQRSDAFLVRMRRTGGDSAAGSSWIGPTLPYLFGRGSMIRGDGGGAPRKDGIAVRATAIATTQPALQVGGHVEGLDGDRRGVASYALEWNAWRDIEVTFNDPACVRVQDNELFLVAGAAPQGPGETAPEPVLIGRLMDPENRARKVGQPIHALPVMSREIPDPAPSELEVWVPLYTDVLGVDRVIGFVYAEIGASEQGGCTTGSFAFSKRAADVASCNASAVFPRSAETLTKAEWNEIFRLRRELVAHPRGEPLLAPALSR